MRLKRLEVHGFKSFAIRQDFGFEPGLTGIVGPNGCGKSNVVDAIKWVLGETRPTSLRGGEMQDVIFKGTASRPPLGYAEVTLVLDNNEQVLVGPSEVSLTRRLYRTGEGEYELNKQDVRRKDLKHLLYGTGLGVNAYSILEQGKIDAILSANPMDRRAIFEEAAGITRFRSDRKEAIRRLESTEKDLESVRAVLHELERQRNSLRVQASRARRHADLADQLRGWRASAALSRYKERLSEKQFANQEVLRLQDLESSSRQTRAQAEEESARAREEAKSLAAEQSNVVSSLSELQSEEGRRTERARAAREHSQALSNSSEAKSSRSAELLQLCEQLRADLESVTIQLQSCEQELVTGEADFEQKSEISKARNDAYRLMGRELEEAQRILLNGIEARTAAQNAFADLEAEDRATRNEYERLQKRLVDIRADIDRMVPLLSEAEVRHSGTVQTLTKLREEEANIQNELVDAQARFAAADVSLNDVEKKLSALESRLHVLRELESSLAGIGAAAKAVIQANVDGVVSHVADLVTTELSYALALEAALGRYGDGVVATSRSAAANCLHFIREKKLGRLSVIVVPDTSINEPDGGKRTADQDSANAIPEGSGVLGFLRQYVSCNITIQPVLDRILKNVVLVESLPDAELLIRNYPLYTFVTLHGERVDSTGVTGGSRETTATPIARKSTITALEIDERSANLVRENVQRERESAEQHVQSARTRQKEWSAMLEAANREAGDAKVAFSELSHRFERLDSERSILDAESVDISTRRNAVMLRRETVERDVRTTVEAVQTASAAVHSVQVKRHEEEKARDEAMALESAARVEVARLRGENERLRSEFARRRDASERTRDEATRLQNESQADASRSQQLAADASALDTSIVELSERRIVLADRLVEIKRLGAAQAEASEEAMRRERERTAILEEVQAQLGSARLHEQRASMQCEEIIDRAREEAHISIPDLADTLTLTEHFQVEYADQKIQELKIKLERLGSVSSDATVELDSIETRFADLDRQRSDLEVAKRTLQETIRELDTQCGIRFRESFDSIRKHFGELFRRLFRGGKADILLQEGVDPLESGVEILAQPPGKKLQTISLLSGGERSLTALALLFAAFKTKPSPFCVLDEVDAALDDANVERFLGMLDEFKSSTQFIVVTHHRRTMSVCSALLGVTMPEHGVSQKVAVRLEDVDRIVPGAVGSVTSGARLDAGRPPAISVEL